MDDVTNGVTNDVTNDVTNEVMNDVTNDVTIDVTDDLTKTRNISEIIVNCCHINPSRAFMKELGSIVVFDYLSDYLAIEQGMVLDISGSCAEFNIVPASAVSCVGDVDLMFCKRDKIILCDGYCIDSVDAEETTDVYKIDTSNCPNGYVHLRKSGGLQFNWDKEQFEYFMPKDTLSYLWASSVCTSARHGPAQVVTFGEKSWSKCDLVSCIRILGWPPVARSWISRERKYAWPSNAIVSEVQRNGCDLVHVSHRDYKHDDIQWRYSFSRAEITLIRNWTPIQQIIYHMLRYVAKRTCEWKDDDKVICTYHLKILMLWACERKSSVWWESNCVLVLSSKLLNIMILWIRKKHCPHYFIPEWNLFDCTMKESRCDDTIETLRILADTRHLSEWFRINYISKIFNSNSVFNGIGHARIQISNPILQIALNMNAAFNKFDQHFHKILQGYVVETDSKHSFALSDNMLDNYHKTIHWNANQYNFLTSSRKLGTDVQLLNLALVSLRLAWNISRKGESELSNHELMDVLREVVLKLSGIDTCNSSKPIKIPFRQCSKWYFIKGVQLLSTHCEKHSAAYCLWMKTCKRFFKSALNIQDEYSASIHDACHVYLSALYYVSGTNQEKSIKHCMEAKKIRSFSNFLKPYIMDYSTLLFVDPFAHMCGFFILFDHVSQTQEVLPKNGFSLDHRCVLSYLPVANKQYNFANENRSDGDEETQFGISIR